MQFEIDKMNKKLDIKYNHNKMRKMLVMLP